MKKITLQLLLLVVIFLLNITVTGCSSKSQEEIKRNANDFLVVVKVTTKGNKGNPEPGNGIIFKSDKGIYSVLTAHHILTPLEEEISSDNKIEIITPDKKSYFADISSISQPTKELDISIFKFKSDLNYSTASLEEKIDLTSPIYLLGHKICDNTKIDDLEFSQGKIKENTHRDGGHNLFYTNAAIAGMSGSPILNNQGNVIGIHAASGPNEKRDIEAPKKDKKSDKTDKSALTPSAKLNCTKLTSYFENNYGIPVSEFKKYLN